MQKFKGTIIPIGGNEDKGSGINEMYTRQFIGEGILSTLLKESKGKNSVITIITTASKIPKEVGQNYYDAFGKLGCNQINILDIRSIDESNNSKNLKIIENTDCLLFSGGDQSEIVKHIKDTQMHEIILDKLYNTEFVVSGTSAGAMCMSGEMIAGGSSTEAFRKGNVKMSTGMNFVSNAIIDSHFIQRGRFGRLAEAMAHFPHLMGIGLSEDTGIVIKNSNDCKVIGSGMVILFDTAQLTHNKVHELEEGTPLSMTNLTAHILAHGDRFTLVDRKISILPITEKIEW
ncbi:MAG: cyanophycinase [Saprospiraceae bacterium]|nr:cyanophycinase [Saprospiraceae bacterium]